MTTKETISWIALLAAVVVFLWKQSQQTNSEISGQEMTEQSNEPIWVEDYYQSEQREQRTRELVNVNYDLLNYDLTQRQNDLLEACLSQFQQAVEEHRQCSNDVERLQQDFDELGRRMAETNRLFLNILQSLE
jgi:hypothetical protein